MMRWGCEEVRRRGAEEVRRGGERAVGSVVREESGWERCGGGDGGGDGDDGALGVERCTILRHDTEAQA